MDLLLLIAWIVAACVGLLVLFAVAPGHARAAVGAVFPFEPASVEVPSEEGVPAQELARRLGWATASGRAHHRAVVLAAAAAGFVEAGLLRLAPLAEDLDVERAGGEPCLRRVRYVTARHPPGSREWWLAWTFTPEGAERMCALARRYPATVGQAFEIRSNAAAARHGLRGRQVVHRVDPRRLEVRVDPWSIPSVPDDPGLEATAGPAS